MFILSIVKKTAKEAGAFCLNVTKEAGKATIFQNPIAVISCCAVPFLITIIMAISCQLGKYVEEGMMPGRDSLMIALFGFMFTVPFFLLFFSLELVKIMEKTKDEQP